MLATGGASLQTFGARAHLGYDFHQQDRLITRSATLARFRTNRNAYAEAGADFNASHDTLSVGRTTATLAVAGERKVPNRAHFCSALVRQAISAQIASC